VDSTHDIKKPFSPGLHQEIVEIVIKTDKL